MDHAYEVVGMARHSENYDSLVIYRPLYEVAPDKWVYGHDFPARPLSLWYDQVVWEGKKIQRFTEIT